MPAAPVAGVVVPAAPDPGVGAAGFGVSEVACPGVAWAAWAASAAAATAACRARAASLYCLRAVAAWSSHGCQFLKNPD